jgi:hypothetical protein
VRAALLASLPTAHRNKHTRRPVAFAERVTHFARAHDLHPCLLCPLLLGVDVDQGIVLSRAFTEKVRKGDPRQRGVLHSTNQAGSTRDILIIPRGTGHAVTQPQGAGLSACCLPLLPLPLSLCPYTPATSGAVRSERLPPARQPRMRRVPAAAPILLVRGAPICPWALPRTDPAAVRSVGRG